ncbi:MAG TPA: hypothetical protein VNV65_00085 [Candidatus Solibacter sp.]|nr:hypothetical protein [Candidatus Solibacter sp.]
MSWARRRGAALALCSAAVGAVSPMAATPAHASLVIYGTCTATMTITAGAPITKVPAFIPLGYSGFGTCAGYPFVTQSMSLSGSGSANVGCDLFETTGSAFNFFFSQTGTTLTQASPGVGTLSSVSFVFPGVNDLTFDAVGTFAWSNASQQIACATSGTSTVTLTGVIMFQDPNLNEAP